MDCQPGNELYVVYTHNWREARYWTDLPA